MNDFNQTYDSVGNVYNVVLPRQSKPPPALLRRALRIDRDPQRTALIKHLELRPAGGEPLVAICLATPQDVPALLLGRLADLLETEPPISPSVQPFQPPPPRGACFPWPDRADQAGLWHILKTPLSLPAQTDRAKICDHLGELQHSVCFGLTAKLQRWSNDDEVALIQWISQLCAVSLKPRVTLLCLIVLDPSEYDAAKSSDIQTGIVTRLAGAADIIALPNLDPVKREEFSAWQADLFYDTSIEIEPNALMTLDARLFPEDRPRRLGAFWNELQNALREACQG
jgi:hypothetical protein